MSGDSARIGWRDRVKHKAKKKLKIAGSVSRESRGTNHAQTSVREDPSSDSELPCQPAAPGSGISDRTNSVLDTTHGVLSTGAALVSESGVRPAVPQSVITDRSTSHSQLSSPLPSKITTLPVPTKALEVIPTTLSVPLPTVISSSSSLSSLASPGPVQGSKFGQHSEILQANIPLPNDLWEIAFQKLGAEDQQAIKNIRSIPEDLKLWSQCMSEMEHLARELQEKCTVKNEQPILDCMGNLARLTKNVQEKCKKNQPLLTQDMNDLVSLAKNMQKYCTKKDLEPLSQCMDGLMDVAREVLEKSTEKNQQSLSPYMNDLVQLTREAQDKCMKKSLLFRFREEDVPLRDVAGRIFVWLNKFKEVGDVAVSFDPVHAALPWAGVRLLLQAATVEHKQMGDLLLATAKIASLINRGTIYEQLYYSGESVLSDRAVKELRKSMTELYLTILEMIALSHRLFGKTTVRRATHAFFNPDKVSSFLDRCETLEAKVDRDARNCEAARSLDRNTQTRKMLEMLRDPIFGTDERMASLLKTMEYSQRRIILDWTSKVLYGAHHQLIIEQRTTDTCKWLLYHKKYYEWQSESSSSILWLYGTAGTGKTFLASKVIDEIQQSLKNNPGQQGFAFFYCNRNESERRRLLSILRAFIRQLSTITGDDYSIPAALKDCYDKAEQTASHLAMGDCKTLLRDLINGYPQTTLVLDGLDECEVNSRIEAIEALEDILDKVSKPLKIFISCRPDGDIKDKLKSRANISINATDNYNDISVFINNEIIKHRRWATMPPDLQALIVGTLQEKSQGMFQWAYLQIKQLLELQRPSEIRSRLGKLPKDLKAAYDEIINNIPEIQREIAHHAIQWVMCAREPLKTRDLLPAICQDGASNTLMALDGLDEDIVLEYCHNLLVIDPVQKVWVPSHLSVIEYYEEHVSSNAKANSLILAVCLTVIHNTAFFDRERTWSHHSDSSGEDPDNEAETEHADPLNGQGFRYLCYYARQHWVSHAQKSSERCGKLSIGSMLAGFLGYPSDSSATYRRWHRMLEADLGNAVPTMNKNYRKLLYPITNSSFAFCYLGFSFLLPNWHDLYWVNNDARTNGGHSYLELAILSGQIQLCRDLIKHGMDVDAQTMSFCGSALASVAARGMLTEVRFLVREARANVDLQLRYGVYGSALIAAMDSEQTATVEFLVKEGGADPNTQLQHGNFGSAIIYAISAKKNEAAMELIGRRSSDVNLTLAYGDFGSALATAAYVGNRPMVDFLLAAGADVNLRLQGGRFKSTLAAAQEAAEESAPSLLKKQMVDLLLHNGAIANDDEAEETEMEMGMEILVEEVETGARVGWAETIVVGTLAIMYMWYLC